MIKHARRVIFGIKFKANGLFYGKLWPVKVPKLTISGEKNCHPDHFNIFTIFLQETVD